MLDLNDLRVFERIAALRSFSAAARALGMPKSSASRSIRRLESELGVRLLQRTSRDVVPTEAGTALYQRCITILAGVDDTVDWISSLGRGPRGMLTVSAGIGAGPNILAELLPVFSRQYPDVTINVDLSSRHEDLVREGIDVGIRIGPMPDSQLIATKLGEMQAYLCASPAYLERRGTPQMIEDLKMHDLIGMAGNNGRPRAWTFKNSGETVTIEQQPRICVNCAVTIHRLVAKGAGIGNVAGYMSGPDLVAGKLVRLFPEWRTPPVEVHAVFPSHRELSPVVRAFVDFLKDFSRPGSGWQNDPIKDARLEVTPGLTVHGQGRASTGREEPEAHVPR